MSRIVAIADGLGELKTQPDDGARDQFDCFKGCRAYGCDATQCRDLAGIPRKMSEHRWTWAVRQ